MAKKKAKYELVWVPGKMRRRKAREVVYELEDPRFKGVLFTYEDLGLPRPADKPKPVQGNFGYRTDEQPTID